MIRDKETKEIRLKDVFALLPEHELVSIKVRKKDNSCYDAMTRLVYEGIPYYRAIAIVEKIEARGRECLEITIKENKVVADESTE